jgi:arylsulfatase A-like enzyme
MEVLDRAVGKVLSALETRGLLDGALVMLCADHGEMNGHRALVDKGAYAHPRVARVPLVVRPPCLHKAFAKSPSGVEVDTPVCLLDIAPTVLAAAGVTPLARLDGMSLMPFLRESASRNANYGAGRTFLFESFWHTGVNPAVALQWRPSPRRHFFYVYNLTSDSDELYDLNGTSYRNLARDRRYARVRRAMIRRLAAFLQSDTRWRCYWHTMRVDMEADLPPQAGDYQMFRPE